MIQHNHGDLIVVQNGIVDESWAVSLSPTLDPTTCPEMMEGNASKPQCWTGQTKAPDHGQTGAGSQGSSQQHSTKAQLQKGSSSMGPQPYRPRGAGLGQAAPHEESAGYRPGASSRARGQRGNRGLHGRGRTSSEGYLGGQQRGRPSRAGNSQQDRKYDLVAP